MTKGYKFIFLTESKKPGENFFSDKYFNKIITQSCVCIYIYICIYIYTHTIIYKYASICTNTRKEYTGNNMC